MNHLLCRDKAYHWKYFNPVIGGHFLVSDNLLEFDGSLVRFEVATEITQEDIRDAVSKLPEAVTEFYQGDRGYMFELDYVTETASNTYEWCRDCITSEMEQSAGVNRTW